MKNLIWLFLFLSLVACSDNARPDKRVQGTDTGNPSTPPDPGTPDPTPPGIASVTVSMDVIANTCEKLVSCAMGAVKADCVGESLTSGSFATKLGVPPSFAPITLENIVEQETQGTLTADTTAAKSCRADIDALSCIQVDTTIMASPMGLAPGQTASPYHNVAELIPPSCEAVFQ